MTRIALPLLLFLSLEALASPALRFGSYGRVGVASGPQGERGTSPQIVQFGPRLSAGDYLELDFSTDRMPSPYGEATILTTMAFDGGLFHYDGTWSNNMALRRFQLEVSSILDTKLYVVVGSQWNRGDDIYLFNFWPLDNLNSTGFTLGFDGDTTTGKLHVGLSQITSDQHLQNIEVLSPRFGSQSAVFLDRQRLVSAISTTHQFRSLKLPQKVKVYGEYHQLPEGKRILDNDPTKVEELPDDLGFLFGLQYGVWGFGDDSHLNLFVRYAKGLAVYDELSAGQSMNRDRRTVDAYETRLALSGNFQNESLSIMAGGYARIFNDGDVNREDFDDRQEVSLALRPMLRLGPFTPAIEASWQASRTNGLNPRTNRQEVAHVFQCALLPALTFSQKPGAYDRPRITGVISYSVLNDEALSYYPESDPRSQRRDVWLFGIGAEWWFGRGGSY